jgi:alpha-beta hydrolase superfamily lysophospholipase
MSDRSSTFETEDHVSLYRRSWLPDGPERCVVVLVHGFTEHAGRYEHVAEEFNRRGIAVHAVDLRGHGRSEGKRIWIKSFSQHLADIRAFVAQVQKESAGRPVFLLGHSMGGTIAALLATEQNSKVRGLVLSAPAVRVGADVYPVLRRLAVWVSRVWPGLRLVRLGNRWLSRDPENVERFRNDPLVAHDRIPVRTAAEILSACDRVQRNAGAIDIPLLIAHGTADKLICPKGSEWLCRHAGSGDKTLIRYEGLYHDLFGEPEKEQVIEDVAKWILSHCE